MRRVLPLMIALAGALAVAGCVGYSQDDPLLQKDPDKLTPEEMGRMVGVVITEYGRIIIELRPDWAPEATRNFIRLARAGYYDGMTICEIRPGVWLRAGAPNAEECKGSPGYFVPIEPPTAAVVRGAVGLHHHDMLPNDGTSQFFIMLTDAPGMNGGYTIFGMVIDGMPAVDRISQIKATPYNGAPRPYKPVSKIVIEDLHLEVKR